MNEPVWYQYRILDLAPEVPEGHLFRSKVPNLQLQPALWQKECPYTISNRAMNYVSVVSIDIDE